MVAELQNSSTNAIYFDLVIASCDCNIIKQVPTMAKNVNIIKDYYFIFYHKYPISLIQPYTSYFNFITMYSKCQRKQLSAAKASFVELFKKRRLEASFIHNLLHQPSVHNNKPNTIDTSLANISDEEEIIIWFWNKSINKIDLDEKEKNVRDMDGKNLEEQSKIEQAISYKALQVELKQKKEGKNNLYGEYEKGLKRTQMRYNKSA